MTRIVDETILGCVRVTFAVVSLSLGKSRIATNSYYFRPFLGNSHVVAMVATAATTEGFLT